MNGMVERAIRTTSWRRAGRILAGMVIASAVTGTAAANPDWWKARGWKTDFDQTAVAFTEILSGGPPKDGIPSIDRPVFLPASQDSTLEPLEPVIRLQVGDDIRAYPLRILTFHEIVNDVVGGKPVAVTYCPLCNASLVFDRTVDGQVLEFGTTGMLRNSDLVMYDRTTESWWQQFTGQSIVGSYTGTQLKFIASRVESFERFLAAHPDGQVLQPDTGFSRPYGRNPYATYDTQGPIPGFVNPAKAGDNPMMRVVALKTAEKPFAVALPLLVEKGSITLGDGTVLSWVEGQSSALDDSFIPTGRDVGNVTVQRPGANGLEDVVHDITFAFAFRLFHPEGEIRVN